MMHVEPSFVLYALRLDPGCCLRAHNLLLATVETVEPGGAGGGGTGCAQPWVGFVDLQPCSAVPHLLRLLPPSVVEGTSQSQVLGKITWKHGRRLGRVGRVGRLRRLGRLGWTGRGPEAEVVVQAPDCSMVLVCGWGRLQCQEQSKPHARSLLGTHPPPPPHSTAPITTTGPWGQRTTGMWCIHVPETAGAPCAVPALCEKVGYFRPVFPDGQGDW